MTEDVLDTVIGQLAETPIPSTRHMTPDERFLGVRQMWSDLYDHCLSHKDILKYGVEVVVDGEVVVRIREKK